MFDSIAKSYDLVNRVVSLGIDKKWRVEGVKEAVELINGNKILDIACGSGDMIEVWKKFGDFEICGLDASEEMLKIAKKRFPEIIFYHALAQNLPCKNESIDVISISFGLRNVVETQKAVDEFKRVLRENGIVLIIEFLKADRKNLFRNMVDFYTNTILPILGGVISKNFKAYKYLPNSINDFYTANELKEMFEKKGFKIEKLKTFNFSQVGVFIFRKV
ncbi:MAG: bifunctional demethylmenaquinone methyltransferase/2-methoxy-6-polyprenyl-1,4-benzoquinol methylase UbiE [Epsilonproteobacteria bacterium]|nr:bifunctional demethylmenaquinone methyltransferase/2-methoxy-6-polyprenyl-1,4-benzoquinol methylase UbiE [Campylobacterota bacterium]